MCFDRLEAWKDVQAGLTKVAEALDVNGKQNGDNLRVVTEKVSYADFATVAPLLCEKSIVSKQQFDTLKEWNGRRWSKVLDEIEKAGLLHVN
ncbi:hypothetical protein H2248_004378 [Termitomyces sp. 'cryptogamus']|nr:hypothetical protein H2248_004378 [Termitomyces sp. 'cryptogamus']